ncbi:hypothetical protein HYQ46_002288 [Verticillium longisporum]|nr:hypothetical protein HYQ46_002288 [Verticillium longisporum]
MSAPTAHGHTTGTLLWGPIDVHLQRWEQNVASSIKAGSTHILSFNECDMPSQCNLDASSAADAHIKHVNPFSKQGLDWLKAWVDACDAKGCVYDFCVVHWYSPLEAADTLFTHIKQASEICGGKPVWLTDIRCDTKPLRFLHITTFSRHSTFLRPLGVTRWITSPFPTG